VKIGRLLHKFSAQMPIFGRIRSTTAKLAPVLGIKALLEDRSAKRAVFEIDSTGRPSLGRQIREDRYYAAHLLGDLKDPRAVPMLVPLLKDEEVNLIVPWSLGEIGDKSAIPPLIEALADSRLEMRAAALRALEKLEAKECRPPLRQIEDGCTIAVNP